MRTASFLKYLTYGVLVSGVILAAKFSALFSLKFWMIIFFSVLIWLLVRIIANLAQIVYDIKAEIIRSLSNIERGIYHSNSIANEIKDLIESDKEESNK
ncbi:MAG: hypothetical protein PHN57_07220 [Candidatus Omnitrophica bacterium]|nr:hypothetical protein [Candidatus Omnitrophota bacterium]